MASILPRIRFFVIILAALAYTIMVVGDALAEIDWYDGANDPGPGGPAICGFRCS